MNFDGDYFPELMHRTIELWSGEVSGRAQIRLISWLERPEKLCRILAC